MTCASSHLFTWKVLMYRAFTADPSTVSSTLVRRQNTRSSSASAASSSAASATGVQAPITTALSGQEPVFRVGYPAGSYSGSTGGTQFYSQALNVTNVGQDYERMMLSYDVWFPQGFAWVICRRQAAVRIESSWWQVQPRRKITRIKRWTRRSRLFWWQC